MIWKIYWLKALIFLGYLFIYGCITANIPEPKSNIPTWMEKPQLAIPGTPAYIEDFPLNGEEESLKKFYQQHTQSGPSTSEKKPLVDINKPKATKTNPPKTFIPTRFHLFTLQNEEPSKNSFPYLVQEVENSTR